MIDVEGIKRATQQLIEFGRVLQELRGDAEAELRAMGIEPDPRMPVLDQLAAAKGIRVFER